MPIPPPTPRIEDRIPIDPATCSRGNSSRTIPNASGKIPPPAPWITRPTTISGSAVASADSAVPQPSTTSVAINSRSLPYMSPSRPMIEVATDADSRYPVSNQVTPSSDAPSACWIAGNAGITAEVSIAYASPPTASTVRITVVWTR